MIPDARPAIAAARPPGSEAGDASASGSTITRGGGPARERARPRSSRLAAGSPPPTAARTSQGSWSSVLLPVVHDFTAAWERGEAPIAEDYLRRLDPADDQGAVDLIYREYCLAEADGRAPDADVYVARFPRHGDALRRLFQVHGACSPSLLGRLLGPAPASGRGPASGVGSGSGLPEVGDSIGPYLLRRELGRGSFARVFLAEQADLANRLVVLKIAARFDPGALAAGPGAARPHRRDPLALAGRRRRVPVDLHAVLGRRDPRRRAGRAGEGVPAGELGAGRRAPAAAAGTRGAGGQRPAPTCWRPSTPSPRPSIRRSARPGRRGRSSRP